MILRNKKYSYLLIPVQDISDYAVNSSNQSRSGNGMSTSRSKLAVYVDLMFTPLLAAGERPICPFA